jgi:2',3'-cyclic-nucleotide 2'-phosphodiesterase (5'-nucleotidase family)
MLTVWYRPYPKTSRACSELILFSPELQVTSEPVHITLLHTNDLHGHLEEMSRLSTYARRLRRALEDEGRRVFFFDAGDAADRRLRFIGATKGRFFPPILAAMGYDLLALGNAISITYGPLAGAEMAAASPIPILAANLRASGHPAMQPFGETASFELTGGLHLGVIGLTVAAPDTWPLFGLNLPDYRDVARDWLQRLRADQKGPVIVLSHLGLREDRLLAQARPGIDVIIGGHSHSLLPEGELVNGVLIAQAGEYGAYLGRVDLTIDAANGTVLEKSATLLPVPPDLPPDASVLAAIQQAEQAAEQHLARSLATLHDPLPIDPLGESVLGNLAADALRERMQAEIAVLTGGLFTAGLPAGTINLGQLDAACFTTANPQVSVMRGEQILAGLEYGISPEIMHLYLKMLRGAPVGLPQVSGLEIEWDPDGPDGSRLRSVGVGGAPLDPQRMYRVAHTDAEVFREDTNFGYFHLEPGQLLRTEVPTILREAVEEYMQANEPVRAPALGRWKVVHSGG